MSRMSRITGATPHPENEPIHPSFDEANTGLLTRLVRARTLGPEALEALRRDVAADSRIGIGYLGIGAIVAAVILSIRGILVFAINWASYPDPWITLVAWIVVAISIVSACLLAASRGGHLPTPAFLVMLVVLSAAVVADLIASNGFSTSTPEVTVIVGAGAALLSVVAYRPLNQLILATLVLAAFLFAVAIIGVSISPTSARPQIEVIVVAIAPTLIAILIVKSFTRFVDHELDRTLVESTLSSPRFTPGILGTDELVRLDQRAEELLSDVASGRISLPLNSQQSAAAGALASDLRLRLVAGRQQTWLQHAIDDSEVLRPNVTLQDSWGLAGYLDADQREGLLSAIWLIVSGAGRSAPSVELTVGPQADDADSANSEILAFPISISIENSMRTRFDAAVWAAFDRVGRHDESLRRGALSIVLNVQVDTPEA